MSTDLFSARALVIATKHHKESVIAPVLEGRLGVECFVVENFDSDTLGTFTGEVERMLDPISTARKKCLLAMEAANCDLGVASEGSFGPHPSFVFKSADEEILIFIDKQNDLEIIVREVSTATNFNGKEIASKQELLEFVSAAKFPSHGIILRRSIEDKSYITKDIKDEAELLRVYDSLCSVSKTVYAETDMRAMNNPSRMAVIQSAVHKLIAKIDSCCPECNTPGFGVTDIKRGLQCSLCRFPTNSTLSHIYTCQKCEFIKEELYPLGKLVEEPTYCDYCNP